MNWSKEKAARFDQQIAAEEAKRWRRAWITTTVAGLLFVVLIFFLLRMMRGDSDFYLTQARQELQAANNSDEVALKLEHASKARDAANRSLQLDTTSPAANLILAASLAIRQDDRNFRIEETQMLIDAKSKLAIKDCKTSDLWQAGVAFFYSGDNQLADEVLTEAYSRNELEAEILNTLIQVRYDRASEDSVLELSQELAKLEPKNCLPWIATAYVYEDRQALEQLVTTYRELLKRNCEGQDMTRWKLVERLIEIGSVSEAEAEWNLLNEKSPEFAKTRPSTNAKLLYLQGKNEETRILVDEILSADADDLDAIQLRGQLYLANDKATDAMAYFRRLIELDPTHPQAHYLLGQAYSKAGMREEAERELALHERLLNELVRLHTMERNAAADSNNAQIRFAIAKKYEELGLHKIAEYWLEQANAISGN